jgi:transposase
MDVIAAYRDVGSYRGAAAICGTTHKTVKRIIEAHQAATTGQPPAGASASVARVRNYDSVAELVAAKVKKSQGKISAKRLLPAARVAGYEGSPRNFRRLVAAAKADWRRGQQQAGGRRPAVWTPGETLVIDWGEERLDGPGSPKVQVFCAVLAWSRFRFVRFSADQTQETTLALLAECLEVIGGVPKVVLADRMGCLKGAVVANVVVPSPDYVRFATHHGFRPDFCNAEDPESKGIVENLVGYAKADLLVPLSIDDEPWKPVGSGLARANARAASWCAEVNAAVHSEICAVPAHRLATERPLLGALPSLRLRVGPKPVTRKVDKLACIRFGSARYSVPNRLIGCTVTVLVDEPDKVLRVVEPVTGEVHAEHQLVAPGETSIDDEHYGRPRPNTPTRRARPRTAQEQQFLALGPVAEAFLVGAAAAGVTKLTSELAEILTLGAAHGEPALLAALERAVAFNRWRAADVRSILATNGQAPQPTSPGPAFTTGVVLTLPSVPTRSLDAYRLHPGSSQGGGEVS